MHFTLVSHRTASADGVLGTSSPAAQRRSAWLARAGLACAGATCCSSGRTALSLKSSSVPEIIRLGGLEVLQRAVNSGFQQNAGVDNSRYCVAVRSAAESG